MPCLDRFRQGGDGGGVGDVERVRTDGSTGGGQLPLRCGERGLVAVGQRQPAAAPGENGGERAPDAARRPGDERRTTF